MKGKITFLILGTLLLASCIKLREVSVFEAPEPGALPPNINGFYGTEIFADELNGDFWHTPNPECYTVSLENNVSPFSEKAMRVTWDKDKGVCSYIGMGFGWNGWMAKDMIALHDSAALSMYVKPVSGNFGNLPVALCFEDYSGHQAWLGFTPKSVADKSRGDGWVRLEFPVSEFNWLEQEANMGNIKQLIIQLEAVGDFYFDEIKFIPRTGGFNKRLHVSSENTSPESVPTAIWEATEFIEIGTHKIQLAEVNQSFKLKVSKAQNAKNHELPEQLQVLLRSMPGVKSGINLFASYDRKINISFSNNTPTITLNDKALPAESFKWKSLPENGIEIEIYNQSIGIKAWEMNTPYQMDVCVYEKVKPTQCWNSPAGDNAAQAPYAWGEIVFIKQSAQIVEKR
jgi:hypothetical protein